VHIEDRGAFCAKKGGNPTISVGFCAKILQKKYKHLSKVFPPPGDLPLTLNLSFDKMIVSMGMGFFREGSVALDRIRITRAVWGCPCAIRGTNRSVHHNKFGRK